MKTLNILIVFVMMAGLIACETEIEFNGKDVKPVMVLNCLACTDSSLEVTLTASRFFLSNDDTFKTITNANIELSVNGARIETLINKGNGIYTSTYKPQAGEQITLIASALGYTTIKATDYFPQRIPIFSVDSTMSTTDTTLIINTWGYSHEDQTTWYSDTIGMSYNIIHHYTIRFTDPPGETNYYRLIVENNSYDWNDSLLLYGMKSYEYGFKDIVFDSDESSDMGGIVEESTVDPLNLFTDELIDGNSHTIKIDHSQLVYSKMDASHESEYNYTRRYKIDIQLQPISKSYYLYLKTFQAFENSDSFMSEPVQIFTNVNNGLGIFGARTQQIKSFVLPTFR